MKLYKIKTGVVIEKDQRFHLQLFLVRCLSKYYHRESQWSRNMQDIYAFIWGGLIASLGGLIGLGGAEFRLPVLASIFKYRTLQAIIINLVLSLITVIFSLIFRTGFANLNKITSNSGIIFNLLAGSLIGAYIGVNFATKISDRTLIRVVVIFLFILSFILISHDFIIGLHGLQLPPIFRIVLGFFAGVVIGVFSSMLGVAGGEMIIPTIVLLYSTDIKLAGSLSLAISIPTIIMGLVKYQRQRQLSEIYASRRFMVWMAIGSIVGALIGSYLLQFVSSSFLYILLGLILFTSALKLASHEKARMAAS
jgi:uncharacterized membrane protein YfcA